MKILLIACLPRRPSLGASLVGTLVDDLRASKHQVSLHDLYAEGFDPVLDPGELGRGTSLDSLVQAHASELAACDGLVIVHPDWWGGPPAILKGWVDRVFRGGVAFELAGEDGAEKEWRPLLKGKRALVLVTSDSTDPRRPGLLREAWVEAILRDCGVEAECRVLGDLRKSTAAARKAWIDGVRLLARATFGQENRAGLDGEAGPIAEKGQGRGNPP